MSRSIRPLSSYDIAVGSSATDSHANPVAAGVTAVRLVTTAACYCTISTAGGSAAATAATKPGGFRLAPNWPEYFRAAPGECVSVIQDATTGTLTVTEIVD